MPENSNILSKNPKLRNLTGFVISAALLYLTFHQSKLALYKLVLNERQWLFFAGAAMSVILAALVQSARAKLLWLGRRKKWSDIKTFDSLVIGNFYNCVLPGNLGEGVRAWHFSKKNNVTFSRSLAAVFTEKWIDAQFFIPVTIILFTVKPFVNNYIFFAIAITALASLGLSVIYALMRTNKRVEKRLGLIALWFKRPGRFFFKFYRYTTQQIETLEERGLLLHYLILCITIFSLNIIQFYLILQCAGVAAPVGGLYAAFFTAVSMIIITFIPSAPSSIGVVHYGIYSVLILSATQFGIRPNASDLQSYALYSVYVHLSYVIPEILLGTVFILKERKTMF